MSSAPPRTYARRHRRHSTAPTRSPSPGPLIASNKTNHPSSPSKSPRRVVEVVVPRSPYHIRVRSPLKRAADSSDTTALPLGSTKRRKIAPVQNAESDSDIEEILPSALNHATVSTPGSGKARKSLSAAKPSSLRKSFAACFDASASDGDALPEPLSTSRRSPRKSTIVELELGRRSPPPKPPLKRVRHPIRLPPEISDQTDTRATSSSDDPILLDHSPVKPVSKPASKRASKPTSKARSTSPIKPCSMTQRKPLSRTPSRLKASKSLPSTTSTPNASQIRRTNTLPTSQSNPVNAKGKGKDKGPLTKDLSELFDFTSPDKDGRGARLGIRAAEPVARRMLARARAEVDLSAENSQESAAPFRIISRVNSFQPAENDIEMADDPLIFPLELPVDPLAEMDTLPIPMRPPPVPLAGSGSGSGLNSGSIRTYAGRSRSFLAPIPGTGLMDFDLVAEPASYRDLRKELGADDLDPLSSPPASPRRPTSPRKSSSKGKARDDGLATLGTGKPKLAPNMHNDVRGLSELRNRGEARRFLDAVQDLFDGLAPESATAVRRASALECLTKLCDKGFARRARASEFRSRVWEAMRARKEEGGGERDRILDACAAAFVGIVVREGNAELNELGRDEEFEGQCWELMGEVGRGRDILDLESAGKGATGRVERMNLATLSKILAKITSSPRPPPLRAHISLALSSLHPSALSPAHLPLLLDNLLPDLALLPSRLTGYTAGLSLLPDPSTPDGPPLEHISHCLTMLDAFLLGRWGSGKDETGCADALVEGISAECNNLAEGLLALAASCRILLADVHHNASEEERETVHRCLESAYRVLVNLSHENAAWCTILLNQDLALPLVLGTVAGFRFDGGLSSKEKGVNGKGKGQGRDDNHVEGTDGEDEADDEEGASRASEFDRLCLALGLLTNLVQTDANGVAKDGVRQLNVNPACPLMRVCAQSCACTQRMPSLDVLAQLYLSTSLANEIEDSDDADVTRAVLRGHLAVLLGLLMRGSEENTAALRHLRDDLLGSAREFAGLYAVVMDRVAKAEAGSGDADEVNAPAHVERGGEKGADVAADVARYLESLRS